MSMFANGTGDASAPSATRVHNFPLPPEGRAYRPTYSGGRYVLPDPVSGHSERFTRATTLAHVLDDTSGLDKWKQRNVVLGLHQSPELLDDIDLNADPREVTKLIQRIADQASEAAGASYSAELGTAIHAWTEAVERDGVPFEEVPDQFQPYLRAYLMTIANAGVTSVEGAVERIVYNSTADVVGTFDRVYELADGRMVIGDIKTSKDLRYGYLGFAMQLAIYATADLILSPDGTSWEPMPELSTDFGLIAHIPSDRPGHCELVTLDLERGIEALQLAKHIQGARRGAGKDIPRTWKLPEPGERPYDETPTERADEARAAINAAISIEGLAAIFDNYADVWTDELTALGESRLADLGK
ncbi:DNA exonuclease [Corynebacterium phage EmiRose]|uniref:DNA exonuclease n=1 Tax=Corynebacterium phage EmiRose TaxID=2565372 RepID=A0A649VQE7_9CAUD|nr:DNA exonuclease [Corynebacterium phage EmiRose]QGJ94162.1 DNA exonuclease [Corynebacterium phage EmiRose]